MELMELIDHTCAVAQFLKTHHQRVDSDWCMLPVS